MKVGSLFTGYGGLDLAVGGELAWYAEIEPAACQVLEAHHPGVPNLGDITQIDWSTVPPVDIITGGYPCQPFSSAGLRKGKDDERHLWPFVRDAIRTLGPRYAILENVRGHLTLGFADVLADLAQIGWDAEWAVVAAADIGAPHLRERIFIVAYAANTTSRQERRLCAATHSLSESGKRDTELIANTQSAGTRFNDSGPWQEFDRGSDGQTPNWGQSLSESGAGGGDVTADTSGWGAKLRSRSGISGRHESLRHSTTDGSQWQQYEPAIRRWEHILGRPAPDPTIMGRNGRPRLNPVFVEWMMGLPEGWVTGHGLSAHKCLKMLGNGVVPQQANYAISQLFQRIQ
jgi:DNA (cytosine-5)-methyltransferase 1